MAEDRRDPRIERIFERLQLKYSYEPEFALSDIVVGEEGSQIRTASHRAAVDEYAVAYSSGALFPPVALHRDSHKIIDGNTRHAGAIKAGVTSHPVYLVDAKTPQLAKIAQGSLNQLNGERLNNEQALETARLLSEQGYDVETIALMTGRKAATVQETIKVIETERRADTLGVAVDGLSKRVKAEAAGIQLDGPFRAVMQAAVATPGIKSDDVREARTKIQATRSENEATTVAQEVIETWEGRTTPPNNKVRVSGLPVRKAAETLAERIGRLDWTKLADADYTDTLGRLTAVREAIAAVPTR